VHPTSVNDFEHLANTGVNTLETKSAIVVEHELGVYQFAVVLDEPVHSVEGASFFVCRQRKNDVAIGLITFLLHPY